MKRLVKRLILIGALVIMLSLGLLVSGCVEYHEIPAGYIGRVLTPTGWGDKILEAGQVNLGAVGCGGSFTSLVILEATTTTIIEPFTAQLGTDKEDHRVLTKDGVPLTVDVYVRVMLPTDERQRNNIFVQMTPNNLAGRVRSITLTDVYNRFATMDVRSKIREIFASYNNYKEAYADFTNINKKIGGAVSEIFDVNHVPLILQNTAVSNMKPDQKIWDAENEKVAAQARLEALQIMSKGIANDPNSALTLKWQYLQKIAELASAGTKIIIITDTEIDEISIPAAVASGLEEGK